MVNHRPPVTFENAKECKEIIGGVKIEEYGVHNNGYFIYKARSIPNERIEKAFGVQNSFTATNKAASQKFRSLAEGRLYFPMDEWTKKIKMIEIVVKHRLTKSTLLNSNINLAELVQVVSMKAALSILFEDFDIKDKHKDGSILQLAKQINHQWMASKNADVLFTDNHQLVQALRAVLPAWDPENPEENPLNFILPGYETVWRVVLRCFIEIVARNPKEQSEGWKEVLKEFLENPTREQLFRNDVNESNVSAAWLAKETLRLYTPTRRIYRQYEDAKNEEFVAAADIETVHRTEEFCGQDALAFRPDRWADIDTSKEDDWFMAFGARPFRCPAGRKFTDSTDRCPFGLTFIAVLVGVMIRQVDDEWEINGPLPSATDPLSTDRDAYEDLALVPKGFWEKLRMGKYGSFWECASLVGIVSGGIYWLVRG